MTCHSKKVRKKRCKECNKLFTPYNSLQKVCSPGCAISYTKKKKANDIKLINGLIEDKKQQRKLQSHLNITKTLVHRYVRQRDYGKPCISCGTPYKDDFDAGHFYPAGKFTSLKFDLDNIHAQCIQCNRYKEGEFEMYSLKLPSRIGKQRYQELVKRADMSIKTVKKWNRDELKIIIKYVKEKIKNL